VRARGFVLVELREGRLRPLREPPAVGEPRALLAERVDLAGLQLQGLQLLRLVAQQLEAGVAVARLAFQLQSAVEELEPHPMGDTDLDGEPREGAIAIEQHPLRGIARQ